MTDSPRTECVFVGGGGNAIEPLYNEVRDFLDRLALDHRLSMFPATIRGYSGSLRRVAPIVRILCREPVSLAHVAKQIGPENVALAHDAAFLLAPRLRGDFAGCIGNPTTAKLRSLRTDAESLHRALGCNDIMGEHYSEWTDMVHAHDVVWNAARYLLDFGEVETDRLHCGILAAILGRRTVLRPNSYFKNNAVFDHSLSRLSNTRMQPPGARERIKNTGLRIVRGVRRRSRWFKRPSY